MARQAAAIAKQGYVGRVDSGWQKSELGYPYKRIYPLGGV